MVMMATAMLLLIGVKADDVEIHVIVVASVSELGSLHSCLT